LEISKEEYACPICNNKEIIEYEKIIECPRCELEFEKDDFKKYNKDQILAIQEKEGFIKFFNGNKQKNAKFRLNNDELKQH
jgi:hypothetical protein